MSSEVKLMMENNLKIHKNPDNYKLNLGENLNNGRSEIFLSENGKFLINSLNVNIDTTDDNQTVYKESYTDLNFSKGEVFLLHEALDRENTSLGKIRQKHAANKKKLEETAKNTFCRKNIKKYKPPRKLQREGFQCRRKRKNSKVYTISEETK